jgi:AcrR family transcriptional regulator
MLVADNGFHGASMSTVTNEAGAATGTGDTRYASKDKLKLLLRPARSSR